MKSKKIILILIIIFFPLIVKADEVEYNIKYDGNNFYEEIIYYIKDYSPAENKATLGDTIINYNRNPLYNNNDIYYNKEINQNNNDYEIKLNYNYSNKEIIENNMLKTCFLNRTLSIDDEKVEFKSLSSFVCLNAEKLTINVTSVYPMEGNGILNNNTYTWIINDDNDDNPNIQIKMYKTANIEDKENQEKIQDTKSNYTNKTEKKDNTKTIIICGISIFILLIAYIIFSKKEKNKFK